MAGKGIFTKTEIFCLILSAVFVLGLGAAFALRADGGSGDGSAVTTWKKTDATDTLPQKINVNTADPDRLQLLPGIGPVLAQRIVAWREENGDFLIAEDLLAVEGIGMTKLDEIRDLIVIQEEP